MVPEKIAPSLLSALEDFQEQGRESLAAHAASLGVQPAVDQPKAPKAVVFLRCDPAADLSGLAQHGIEVNQSSGSVRTAHVPMDSLDPLSDDPNVHRILPSRFLNLAMDVASEHVGATRFRNDTGLTGQNVVVGIIDTGIDPKHPAFAGRIDRIWDQTVPGPGVPEGSFGLELAGANLTASRDTRGHGTHVSGIAAAADPTLSGVAPNAKLVIVKTTLQNAHIADGVRYVFRVARDLGLPAVVNLSLGGHGDAHDGTDPLSQIIDSESGPGRIVCCAAGNEGNDDIHARVRVIGNATQQIRFRVPSAIGASVPSAILNGWYSGSDRMEVSIRTPGGFATPFQAVLSSGSPSRTHDLSDARVRIVTPGPDLDNSDHNFFVELRGPGGFGALPTGTWTLRVRGVSVTNGRVDVWAMDGSNELNVVFTGAAAQDDTKIGSPGCASRAITVASFTTRVKWTDSTGATRQSTLALRDISDFSSEGPLRNGAQKPDVAAPGAMIVSCVSADAPTRPDFLVGNGFRANAGTSMATPFVTGIVALLLERQPAMTPEEAKALLQRNSRIPNRAAGSFDNKWGFGLVNALGLGSVTTAT
jgi:subtilisin family serine protease